MCVCAVQTVACLHTRVGACRAVKYSGGGCVDLLAFSEHSDACHLVDTRAFHQRQVSARSHATALVLFLQAPTRRFMDLRLHFAQLLWACCACFHGMHLPGKALIFEFPCSHVFSADV